MTDRRETHGTNWRLREAVGIRPPPRRPAYEYRVLERLEVELRDNLQKSAAPEGGDASRSET